MSFHVIRTFLGMLGKARKLKTITGTPEVARPGLVERCATTPRLCSFPSKNLPKCRPTGCKATANEDKRQQSDLDARRQQHVLTRHDSLITHAEMSAKTQNEASKRRPLSFPSFATAICCVVARYRFQAFSVPIERQECNP